MKTTKTQRARSARKSFVLFVSLCFIFAVTIGSAGCQQGHGTASVSGTVVYKGQPVDGATVIFHPQGDATTARPAQGKTESGGQFTLTTYFGPNEQPAGALPGDYKVTVTKIDEPMGAYDPHKDPPLKNHLPVKYALPHHSPLKITINPGANRPELKLGD